VPPGQASLAGQKFIFGLPCHRGIFPRAYWVKRY